MRKTHAPSQGFKSVTFRKDVKPFPEAARSTSQVLNLLLKTAEPSIKPVQSVAPINFSVSEMLPIKNNSSLHPGDSVSSDRKFFNVMWGKQTKKKHKTWEGDGILEVHNNIAILKDQNGVVLERSSKLKDLTEGSRALIGSKEIEIIDVIDDGENTKPSISEIVKNDITNEVGSIKCSVSDTNISNMTVKKVIKRFKSNSGFAIPFPNESKNILVMPRPNHAHQWKYNSENLPIKDVQLDLFLSRVLRPHQKQGLLFLYSCVTGIRDIKYSGAILADEMGLGKTLQCISLIWILLRTGPYGALPLVQRVLVVTPSSLVTNWYKEFKRWLGFERLHPFIINKKQKPSDYTKLAPSSKRPVLIISYEMLIRHYEDINKIKFQLLICDEGHRLKNNQIRVSHLLSQLNITRRIVLTGTPVQNNLQEFYALIDFVNPGILGHYSEFKKYFENPIVASSQPNCSEEVKETGEKRANELNHRTSSFILRRTQGVIDQYLPSKQECIILCSPTLLQMNLYEAVISYWSKNVIENSARVPALSVITILKKICNDARLVKIAPGTDENADEFVEEIKDLSTCSEELLNNLLPVFEKLNPNGTIKEYSSKMTVLENFLCELFEMKEKVVLISYYTQMLDLLQDLCNEKKYTFLRLDGSTPACTRLEIVEKFNSPNSIYFVFLLSAKAGGVGLNLTGASRLVLFDLDWNPASDLQAMSRIWRDGQKKNVYTYRFLTTGSIEEKIYLRQISKTFLRDAVVDTVSTSSTKLSMDELKDLFTFTPNCGSHTHELLMCECDGCGIPETVIEEEDINDERPYQLSISNHLKTKDNRISELCKWEHYSTPIDESILTELCLKSAKDSISFIFRSKTSNGSE